MKKIICFVSILFIVTSCYDDFYTEGRVKTNNATEITNNSAVLHGNVKLMLAGKHTDPEIWCGFSVGTNSTNLVMIQSTDFIKMDNGDFSYSLTNLTPNTKYYIKACIKVNHYVLHDEKPLTEDDLHQVQNIFYGNLIEFTTDDGEIQPTETYIEFPAAGIAVQKEDITASGINWTSANALCENSIIGDFTDWRMPAIEELATLYSNRNVIGGFKDSGWPNPVYWSSTSSSSNYYYQINFLTGSQRYGGKDSSSDGSSFVYYCRCVRTLTE